MSEELIRVNDQQAREVGLPSPAALDYMMSVANMLLTSNLLGPDLEPSKDQMQALVTAKWPQDQIDAYRDRVIKSNALAKMLIGREMGIEPISALQDVSIVKGKMFLHYSALIRQMEMKGYACQWVERSNERAALKVSKNGQETLFEFTIKDAEQAGLLSSPPGKEQYNQYRLRPRVMLTGRVASEAYRTTGGRANVYTPEEKQEVLSRSTTDEPDESDIQRAAVLEQKYHVGLKDTAREAAPVSTPAEPEKSKVAEMPKPAAETTGKPNGKAETKKPAPKTTAEPTGPAPKYAIYYLDREGGVNRMASEDPQAHLDSAKLRAQALCNETKGTYYVYGEIDGVRLAGAPEFTAEPPKQPASAPQVDPAPASAAAATGSTPLKQRFIEITKQVERLVNNGLEEKRQVPIKTVGARVTTFFVNYFNCGKVADLPKDLPENQVLYAAAFADLESVAIQDANVLMSAPDDTGKRMAQRTARIGGFLNVELKWPAELVGLGFRLARLRGLEFNDVMTFLQNIKLISQTETGWKTADVAETRAALKLCIASRAGGKFVRQCNEHNLSIAKSLEFMEQRRFYGNSIETVGLADVEKAIDWGMEAIKEKAQPETKEAPASPRKREPEAEPQQVPATTEDEGENLFSDLP